MSRAIRVGDLALVNGVSFEIQGMEPGKIYIAPTGQPTQLSLLIPQGGTWQVYAYNLPHTVTFQAEPELREGFTGIPDTDILILAELNLDQLQQICNTNSYFYNLCKNNNLWRLRVINEFGPIASELKPPQESSREQYFKLQTMDSVDAIKDKRMDYLYAQYYTHGVDNRGGLIETASELNNVEFLQYLMQKGYDIKIKGGRPPVMKDNLKALKWLVEHGSEPTNKWIYAAAEEGAVDTLDWLLTNYILNPNINVVLNEATENGHIEILNYLAQNQNVFPNTENIVAGLKKNHFELIEWLQQNDLLQDMSLGRISAIAANKNRLDIVQWLYQNYEILPNSLYINSAGSDLKTFKWLLDHHIYPVRQSKIDNLYNLEKYKLLYQQTEQLPSSDVSLEALVRENYELYDWLHEHGVTPAQALKDMQSSQPGRSIRSIYGIPFRELIKRPRFAQWNYYY